MCRWENEYTIQVTNYITKKSVLLSEKKVLFSALLARRFGFIPCSTRKRDELFALFFDKNPKCLDLEIEKMCTKPEKIKSKAER